MGKEYTMKSTKISTPRKFLCVRYCLVINDSARSNYIESVTQQWRKSAPPILSNSQCEFNGAVCAPTLEKPSPWHLFTHLLNFNVSRIVELKSFDIHYMSFPHESYKLLPDHKNILGARQFFFLFLSFSSHTFLWACGSLREP